MKRAGTRARRRGSRPLHPTHRNRRKQEEFRPTLARVRDAVFNSLGPRVEGARVLDLYAGSGALGIEALRRGAASALFVEYNARLTDALRRRLVEEGIVGQAEVWRREVLAAVREVGTAGRQFDIILLDPPYGRQLVEVTLHAMVSSGILAAGGMVVAEGHWRDRPGDVNGLTRRREARYGETAVWYFERAGGDGS